MKAEDLAFLGVCVFLISKSFDLAAKVPPKQLAGVGAIAGTRYRIKEYSKRQAKKLGVVVKPSRTGNYKIDVRTKDGDLITRIGDKRYKDYPTYMQLEAAGKVPVGYADERRKLYKQRHESTRNVKESRSWYSDKILW
jgi:hypothetical protein